MLLFDAAFLRNETNKMDNQTNPIVASIEDSGRPVLGQAVDNLNGSDIGNVTVAETPPARITDDFANITSRTVNNFPGLAGLEDSFFVFQTPGFRKIH